MLILMCSALFFMVCLFFGGIMGWFYDSSRKQNIYKVILILLLSYNGVIYTAIYYTDLPIKRKLSDTDILQRMYWLENLQKEVVELEKYNFRLENHLHNYKSDKVIFSFENQECKNRCKKIK